MPARFAKRLGHIDGLPTNKSPNGAYLKVIYATFFGRRAGSHPRVLIQLFIGLMSTIWILFKHEYGMISKS